jgi:hypothetical protein
MKRSKATKRSRKAAKKRTKPDDKEAATSISAVAVPHVEEAVVAEAPEPEAITWTTAQPEDKPAVLSSRSEAARRTAEGKFTNEGTAVRLNATIQEANLSSWANPATIS